MCLCFVCTGRNQLMILLFVDSHNVFIYSCLYVVVSVGLSIIYKAPPHPPTPRGGGGGGGGVWELYHLCISAAQSY